MFCDKRKRYKRYKFVFSVKIKRFADDGLIVSKCLIYAFDGENKHSKHKGWLPTLSTCHSMVFKAHCIYPSGSFKFVIVLLRNRYTVLSFKEKVQTNNKNCDIFLQKYHSLVIQLLNIPGMSGNSKSRVSEPELVVAALISCCSKLSFWQLSPFTSDAQKKYSQCFWERSFVDTGLKKQ